MPKIKLTTPDGSKMEFDLTIDRATIGRAEGNDIVVSDGSVSSRHGEILLKGEEIELVDLGSTNGTHVGGQRVERATIAPGGTFKLGNVEGILMGAPAAAQVPPKPSSAAPQAPPKPSGAPQAPPRPSSAAPQAPPRPSSAAPQAPPKPAVVEAPAVEAEAEAEAEAAVPSSWSGAAPAAVSISGLGATPCPVRERKGFGPKVKEKDKVATLISAFGFLSILVCAGAAFLIYQMGA